MAKELIDSKLECLHEDLWIQRRFNLDGIIQELEKLTKLEHLTATDRDFIADWLQFIKFLTEECSGKHYGSDRQWGELMNLMSISRKLNHRSVKLKDILKNKSLIEARAGEIRQLNQQARLCDSIENSIKELEAYSQACRLSLRGFDQGLGSGKTLIVEELANVDRHLKSNCWPILHTVKLELDNRIMANDIRLEQWLAKMTHLEVIFKNLTNFIERFHSLEINMTHLEPLVMSVSNRANAPSNPNTNQHQLDNSLSSCRTLFNQALTFRGSLIESLQRQASRTRQLRDQRRGSVASSPTMTLLKLLNPKGGGYLNDDQYGSGLLNAVTVSSKCRDILDSIMSSLRLEFGRFYFVSDLELLTIISLDTQLASESQQERNKRLISKLFNGSIDSFELKTDTEKQLFIGGVRSPLGELVPLKGEDPVPLRKRVNIYSLEIVRILNEVIRKLRRSLRSILKEHLDKLSIDRDLDNNALEVIGWDLPIQLLVLAEQIKFTRLLEHRLQRSGKDASNLERLLDEYQESFKVLSTSNPEFENSTGDDEGGKKLAQLKRSAALSTTVQFISTLVKLKSQQVSSIHDWNWRKLTRYYVAIQPDGSHLDDWVVEVHLANARFTYKFDYLPVQLDSNSKELTYKRLISTQTSERCFLVASQAISRLNLGASPIGQAGSGKTETIKALGQAIGCQVIVHNCDETNDQESLDRLVWGLAHTGLWGCFDEFNRLCSSTLSSISASLELIQSNLRESRATIELKDGSLMSIDLDCAFFITLNPTDKLKYLGRRRLPANLRSLFLPIAMNRVQIEAIVGDILLSHGGELMSKCNTIHLRLDVNVCNSIGCKLAKWIDYMASNAGFLEADNSCEWDLRLVMAILKRIKSCLISTRSVQDVDSTIARNIWNEVYPRLTIGQLSVLDSSLSEVFGTSGQPLAEIQANQRSSNVISSCKLNDQLGDTIGNYIRERSVCLHEQLLTRLGVILLGPTCSGKSSAWRHLQASTPDESIHWIALNPKSCSKDHLFGSIDEGTRKWTDGCFTKVVRDSLSILQDDRSRIEQVWIVLDSSIDPDWIESLNSVLDDNQVLTLSSGERLCFLVSAVKQKCIKLIFETTDISFASPATISRLGLVRFEICITDLDPVINNPQLDKVSSSDGDQAIRQFVDGQTGYKLLLVSGQGHPEGAVLETLGVQNKRHLIYNCNQYSNYLHLLELLERSVDYIVLRNVHLIGYEDAWNTRTLLEQLRYILTYGSYFDHFNLNFKATNTRFIVSLDDLNKLKDSRLVSIANHVKLDGNESGPTTPDPMDLALLNDLSSLPSIVTIQLDDIKQEKDILELIYSQTSAKDGSIPELWRFNNGFRAGQAIAKLDRILRDKQVANTSKEVGLFIVKDYELDLLERQSKTDLFHLLNLLNIQPNRFKFIHLCHHDNLTFWKPLGQVYTWRKAKGVSRSLTREMLSDKLPSVGVEAGDVEWIIGKLETILASPSNRGMDNRYRTYVTCDLLIRLIMDTRESVLNQRKTLTLGLQCLGNFENSIEAIKRHRSEDEQHLRESKSAIGALIKDTDRKLENANKKQEDIKRLQELQAIKSREVVSRSKQIEEQLEGVSPLIEASRLEVQRSLKSEALNEIRTLRSPPKTIKDILEVLLVILFSHKADTSWTAIKSYLAKNTLKDDLARYDFTKNLNQTLLNQVQDSIKSRKESFKPEQAAKASSAIVPIVNWIQAAIQYGQVIVRLKPLTRELDQLRMESDEIGTQMKAMELEQQVIDDDVKRSTMELERLRQDYQEAVDKSLRVQQELDQARDVRNNLNVQALSWQSKLDAIEFMLSDRNLWKYCLMGATIATSFGGDNEELIAWRRILDLPESSINQLAGRILSLSDPERDLNDQHSRPLEIQSSQDHWIQLISLKLLLSKQQNWICLLDTNGDHFDEEQLVRYLSHDNVLCQPNDVAVIVANDNLTDWTRLVDISIKLDRTIVIPITNSPLDLDIIDVVINNMESAGQNSTSSVNCHPSKILLIGEYDKLPMDLRRLIRSMKVSIGSNRVIKNSSVDDIKSLLIDHFTSITDPDFNKSIDELERELRDKRNEFKSKELALLRKLKVDGIREGTQEPHCGNVDLNQHYELIHALGELHQLNVSMKTSLDLVLHKLQEFKSKREQHDDLAEKAARIYIFLHDDTSQLGQVPSDFSRLPLKRYAELLMEVRLRETSPSNATSKAIELIGHIMKPMHQSERKKFQQSLVSTQPKMLHSLLMALFEDHSSNDHDDYLYSNKLKQISEVAARNAADLRLAALALLSDLINNNNNANGGQTCKLMVVLHDAKRSSPQVELDELMRLVIASKHVDNQYLQNLTKTSAAITYKKLYATTTAGEKTNFAEASPNYDGDNHLNSNRYCDKLESDLIRILDTGYQARSTAQLVATTSTAVADNNNNIKSSELGLRQSNAATKSSYGKSISVVCIVNAHLATKWINARLLDLLRDTDRFRQDGKKLLVILVAESNVGHPSANQGPRIDSVFNMNLLDGAHVKYWHDEMALGLVDRYNSTVNLLACNQLASSIRENNLVGRLDPKRTNIGLLLDGLVLFHVVCQELTSLEQATSGRKMTWQSRNYDFDYDLLCLALKILQQILNDSIGGSSPTNMDSIRNSLCNNLEDLVYGSRMETLEDEILLKKLIHQYMGSFARLRANQDRFRELAQQIQVSRENASQSNVIEDYQTFVSDFICNDLSQSRHGVE